MKALAKTLLALEEGDIRKAISTGALQEAMHHEYKSNTQ